MKYNQEGFEKLAEIKSLQESNFQSTENGGAIFSINEEIKKKIEDKIHKKEEERKEKISMNKKMKTLGYVEISAKDYLEGLKKSGFPLEISYTKKFIDDLEKKAANGITISVITPEKEKLIIDKAMEILDNDNDIHSFLQKKIKPLTIDSLELTNLKELYEYYMDFISKIHNHPSLNRCKTRIREFFDEEIERARNEEVIVEKQNKEIKDYEDLPFYKKAFTKNPNKE